MIKDKTPRNIQESFNSLVKVLGVIGDFNNVVMGETRNLHMQTLNLRIDGVKIKEPNGVGVIATRIQQTVDNLNQMVTTLTTQYEAELIRAMGELGEYIRETEERKVR